MSVANRGATKRCAAMLAACALATSPVVVTGPSSVPALSNVAVQPLSFVTDSLYSAADLVAAAASVLQVGADALLGVNDAWDDSDFAQGVPVNPVFLAVDAVHDPGSALSYLIQLYLNPSDNYNPYTYAWEFKITLQQAVAGLPAGLALALTQAINNVADGVNAVLSRLPDPTPTVKALAQQYSTVLGRLVYALQDAAVLPVTLAVATVYWASYMPAEAEASIESAFKNPSQIPGLISNLVWDALDPSLYKGFLGNIAYNLVKPLFYLPAPIGESAPGANDGLAYTAYSKFVTGVQALLSHLPTPIAPTPFTANKLAADSVATPSRQAATTPTQGPSTKTSDSDTAHTDGVGSQKRPTKTNSAPANQPSPGISRDVGQILLNRSGQGLFSTQSTIRQGRGAHAHQR